MSQKDKFPALVFLAIGMMALITMYRLPFGTIQEPDSAFFPVILSILLIGLSLILLGQSIITKLAEQRGLWEDRWQKLIPAIGVLIAYAFLLKSVGYVICTLSVLIFSARQEKCSWKTSFLISFLCTFLSYSVFRWYLKSPLPQGIVPF